MAGAFQSDAFQSDAFQTEDASQSVALGLIDQTAVAYTPTITPGAVAITFALIDQTAVTYSPTITRGALLIDFINQTATPYAPTVTASYSISVGLINQTAAAHAPSLSLTIGWGDWSDIYGNEAGTLGFINQTAVAYAPTLSLIIYVGLINQTASPFSPTVTTGAVSIALGRITQTAAAFDPQVSAGSDWHIDQTAVAFAPTVDISVVISFDRIGNLATIHSPLVQLVEELFPSPAFINQTAVAFTPTVTGGISAQTITVALINRTAVASSPTIPPKQTVSLFRIEMEAVPFDPTVSPHTQNIALPAIQTAVVHAPTVSGGLPTQFIDFSGSSGLVGGFTDGSGAAGTLTDPPAGLTTFTVDPTSFTIDPSDPDEFMDWTNDGGRGPYSAWLKLVLTASATLTIDTYGSGMLDTELFMYGPQATAPTGSDTAAPDGISDDTAIVGGGWGTYSMLPSVGGGYNADGTPGVYGPGTYWICVFPYRASGWDTSEGSFTLNINRFDDPPSGAFIRQTAVAYEPTVTLLAQGLFMQFIDRTAVARTPTVTGGNLPQGVTLGTISNGSSAFAPLIVAPGAATVTPAPPAGTPVRVVATGPVGDMTDAIVWRMTELNTAVGINGSLGVIVMRDVGQDVADFPVGMRVDIDFGPGTRVIWSGYVLRAGRRFWFDVDYPDTMQRQWRLAVVDVNILNGRRVVYNKANPANVNGPKYTSETYDDVALANLFANWLDLSFDGLDLTTEVHRVGLINPGGQVSYPWNGGMTMGEAVRNVAQLPAAVYGINPERQYVYADVDSANAPFILTDEVFPGGRPSTAVGYRECTIYWDFSNPINDFLAWGAGKGQNHMVFHRRISDSSVNQHGLWQESFFTGAVWKQSTIEKVTDSAVNGSPGSRRGHKEDRMEVACVIHENGLRVGDRVLFRSVAHGFEDVIPVRKMRMTFPTPYDVRYELTLSHEIDRWGFEDPLPPIAIPDIPIPDYPPIEIGTIDDCVTADFPIDAFARTASGSAPWTSTKNLGTAATEWGGQWKRDPDLITVPLSFPGTSDSSTGTTVNKVSAIITPTVALTSNAGLVIHFVSHDPGAGNLGTHGVISPTTNSFRDAVTGDMEVNASVGVGGFIYYFQDGGTYNPDLTGSGSAEFYEPRFGSTGDTAGVSGGVAFAQVTNGHWAAALPFNPVSTAQDGAWAQPISTGRFKIRLPFVPGVLGAGNLRIKYGPATLYIVPSTATTELTLVTGTGATADAMDGWIAGDWYTVEIIANLYDDVSTVKIYDASGALRAQMRRSNANEDPGTYTPVIGFRVESTTASPFRFDTMLVESSSYSTGTGILEPFGTDVEPNQSGWGTPWVTYTDNATPAPTPDVEWEVSDGYGKATRITLSALTGWAIEQPLSGGSVDVQFQMRNYSLHASILTVYFGKTGFNTKNPQVSIGTTTTITQGTGSGSVVSTNTSSIVDGGPVNVHINWTVKGCKVWLWDPNLEEEPETPTLLIARNASLPIPLVWGFVPQLFSGETIWIGPLDEDTPMHGKVGMIDLSTGTGIIDVTNSLLNGTNGRHRSWPTADPGDGRSYGVSWNPDEWTTASSGPNYQAGVVYGQFGDLGPGADHTKAQNVVDYILPRILDSAGNPYSYDVIIEAELGIGFSGNGTGSGVADVLVPISTFDYSTAGLPTPGYTDDYIAGNRVRAYVSGTAHKGYTEWHSFKFRVLAADLEPAEDLFGTPRIHLRWGIHTEDAWDIVRSAGPWDIPLLPFFPFTGGLNLSVRNVKVKLDLNGVPVINLPLQEEPCPPQEVTNTPDGVGVVSQGNAERQSDTIYRTPVPYVTMSLVVWVDGKIQRWGLDFVELDPDAGTFQFTSGLVPAAVVNTQYTTREM